MFWTLSCIKLNHAISLVMAFQVLECIIYHVIDLVFDYPPCKFYHIFRNITIVFPPRRLMRVKSYFVL